MPAPVRAPKPLRNSRWHVYLVRCRDGALYTGIATDVFRRLAQHERGAGEGAKYLRGRGPLRLVLDRAIGARGLALRVEARIKRLSKARKEALIGRDTLIRSIVSQAGKKAPRSRRPQATVRLSPSAACPRPSSGRSSHGSSGRSRT